MKIKKLYRCYLFFTLLFVSAHSSAQVNITDQGYSWKNCEQDIYGKHTIPFDKDGNFRPECAPDVLYSWKKLDFIQKMAKNSTPDNVLPLPHNKRLFTWRTPLGSFGYDDYSIRMKLKPGVKFKLIKSSQRECSNFTEEEKRNTVFVSHLSSINFAEYIICSSGPIASWSYGTIEHYTEMMLEKAWVDERKKDHDEYGFDHILKYDPNFISASNFDKTGRCYWNVEIDTDSHGTDWTTKRLLHNLEVMKNLAYDFASKDEKSIFYAKGFEDKKEDHFKTKYSSYLNHL